MGESNDGNVIFNLNNLFDTGTGSTTETPTDAVVRITEYRGLNCTDAASQRRTTFGRIPAHEETPPISELEQLTDCFFADRVCDNTVDILDVQFVLNAFDENAGTCRYNDYLDIAPPSGDGTINILDVQAVLNRFGESAPFQ
jgi:hypothetical protein